MKIVYCGIDVYLPVFEYLADSPDHEIIELHTYHEEKEYIRDEKITLAARQRNIPVTLDRISPEKLTELFASGACDLLISAEYDRKLPIVDLENFRGINIHNSLLPEGRGYFPVEMRLYKGYTYGGVTIHKLAERVDRGDILSQEKFPILPVECSLDIYEKSSWIALTMIKKIMADFPRHWEQAYPQNEANAVWWPLPAEDVLTITPEMYIDEIQHIFRSFSFLTRLRVGGKQYAVLRVECWKDDDGSSVPVQNDVQGAVVTFGALDGIVRVDYRKEARQERDESDEG